jgi:hypothetical protein
MWRFLPVKYSAYETFPWRRLAPCFGHSCYPHYFRMWRFLPVKYSAYETFPWRRLAPCFAHAEITWVATVRSISAISCYCCPKCKVIYRFKMSCCMNLWQYTLEQSSFHMHSDVLYHFLIHIFNPPSPHPFSMLASCNQTSDLCRPNIELGERGALRLRLSNCVKLQHMSHSFFQRL